MSASSIKSKLWALVCSLPTSAALGRWLGLTVAAGLSFLVTAALYATMTGTCMDAILSDLDARGRDSAAGVLRTSLEGSPAPTPIEFNYAAQEDEVRNGKNKRLTVEKWPAEKPLSIDWPYLTALAAASPGAGSATSPASSPTAPEAASSTGEAGELESTDAPSTFVRASYTVRLNPPDFSRLAPVTPAAPAAAPAPSPPAAAQNPTGTPSPAPASSVPDPYNNSYLLCVEVVEVRTRFESQLRVEVAYQHRDPPDDQNPQGRVSMRRIEWWKGLADSNSLLLIKRRRGTIPLVDASFPTTINAFTTYLEERFLNEAKVLNPDYAKSVWLNRTDAKRFATGAVAPLKAMLTHDFEPTVQSTPVLLLLLFSQHIQFVCLCLWITFLICLVCRQVLFVRLEQCGILWSQIPSRFSISRKETHAGVAVEDALMHGWREVLEHSSYLDQLLACVSLTGYVGTLYFLAISFPEASNLISSSRVEMISSLSRFTLLMAGAFTTSLWSSCWFQFGSWLKNVQLTAELRQIDRERQLLR